MVWICRLGERELIVEQEVHTTNVKVTSMREQLQKSMQETHQLRTKLNTLGIIISEYY